MTDLSSDGKAQRAGTLDNETITDPINRALISALWHSHVALSATSYVDEYTNHGGSPTYANVIAARLVALEAVGVVRVDRVADGEAFYVLGGVNASEAVRRLELAGDGRRES
ncbi:MAG: hypothetical protein JSR84_00935 [Proteobacteria bacterium]|nr:hypothetical protein [Pseudomonadota bacterium]